MRIWRSAGALALAFGAAPVAAQQPDMGELVRRIEALQQRVDQLESERREPRPARARPAAPAQAAVSAPPAAPSIAAVVVIPPPRPPEVVRAEVDQALRGDLDGLAVRVPNTDTTVRLYGFSRRDLEDGARAAGPGGVGHGIANRLVAFGIARF